MLLIGLRGGLLRSGGSALLLSALLLAFGCGARDRSLTPAPAPSDLGTANVLLVTIDTLRADFLPSYGGTATTPILDRLAQEGFLFENAVAAIPSTRPSHASMFTGLYPRQHRVLSNAASLDPTLKSLPVRLSESGYETAGFTGVKLLAAGSGLEAGFEVFDAPDRGHRRAGEVLDQAIEWLQPRLAASREGAQRAPWFQWVHVYDPHMPYGPPNGETLPLESGELAVEFSRPLIQDDLLDPDGNLPEWALGFALRKYREEIEYVDRQLGRLVSVLEESGELDNTLVIVTADHGECFEKGFYFEHGRCLYEGAVRVPLIVRFPPRQPERRRLTHQVGLTELAPTILSWLELPPLGGRTTTTTLLDTRPRVWFVDRPVYDSEVEHRRLDRLPEMLSVAGDSVVVGGFETASALRTDTWKLILDGERAALFDLSHDPHETDDLTEREPEMVERLKSVLEGWQEDNALAPSSSDLDPELESTLRALGYL